MDGMIFVILVVCIIVLVLLCVQKKVNNDRFTNSNMYDGPYRFTAIVQNHNRPQMAKKLLDILERSSSVSEILLLQSKYDTFIDIGGYDKVISLDVVESDKKYGVRNRFMYAYKSSNEYLLYVDDDMYPDDTTISVLLKLVVEDPDIIHGLYGRDNDYGYVSNKVYDIKTLLYLNGVGTEVDIVLTKILATTKSNVKLFEDNAYLVEDYVLRNGPGVKWNGEDIFFNMIVKYNTGRKNKIYPLRCGTEDDGMGISSSSGHMEYRRKLVKYINSVLS